MDNEKGSVTLFLDQMMAGDEAAVTLLWERFLPRLLGLARKTLGGQPQRMADANDAVQSAFASFWNRAVQGEFGQNLDRGDLWNLLGVITVRKSLRQVRHERAARRGGGKTITESDLSNSDGRPGAIDNYSANISPVDLDLASTELLEQLSDELREIAVMRLLGYRNKEMAERMNCSERSIERKIAQIRVQWEAELGEHRPEK